MIRRNIEPNMVTYIDGKLFGNGLAQEAIKTKNARLLFILVQQTLVGIREVGGNNSGPLVELMQETIGGHSKEAWCMSEQQTALAYVEVKTGIQSPIPAGEHCLTVLKQSPVSLVVKKIPAPGAMVIWQHGTSPNGHTGTMVQWGKTWMNCIEGNTEHGIVDDKIERDGGGVYYTKRSTVANGDMHVLAFLKPF